MAYFAVLFVPLVGAVIGAWFAALVLGRVPQGLFRFIVRVDRYWVRVTSYLWLLTDEYPSFDIGAADYPVSFEAEPTALNRA
ncbi:MAG: putative transrane protein, partial [Acidimicrobiia bacterium]|nr:putative transrane protein [Acidimicrobiia bacterium]